MYQIDNSTAATTIPAPTPAGSPGFFTDGNPATGVAATIMPAEFMNALMMENLNVLSAAGIAPAKGQYNQLALAISKIVSSGTSWDKITNKPTTLSGFGITDAMKAGAGGLTTVAPTVVGKVADLPGSQFIFTSDNTTDTPPGFVYSLGFHIKGPDGSSVDLFSSVVSEDFVIRRNYSQNPTPGRRLWHSGNFDPASKANKADVMPIGAGGLLTRPSVVNGNLNAIPNTLFFALADATGDRPAGVQYAAGVHVSFPGGGATDIGIDFAGSVSGNSWFGGRRYSADGTGVWVKFWTADDFNPANKADKASTLGGYGINDAYTKSQVDNAVSTATSNKADKATTLAGYGINNAYTSAQVDSALAGKFDKSGGTITGATTINTAAQSNATPGLTVINPGQAGASANLMLSTGMSGVFLSHASASNTLYVRNHASGYADIDAGDVYAFGSRCHTAATFLKPATGLWVQLTGSGVIPAGGTWAYQITFYNGSGSATGSAAGVVAGGTTVGSSNAHGLAWKISS